MIWQVLQLRLLMAWTTCGEYELSDKFREAIKEAAKILKEFENRG